MRWQGRSLVVLLSVLASGLGIAVSSVGASGSRDGASSGTAGRGQRVTDTVGNAPGQQAADAGAAIAPIDTTPSPPVGAPGITLDASADAVQAGRRVILSGTVTGMAAGTTVSLYKSPYPFTPAKLVQSTSTAADGTYSFTAFPDRTSRYRVLLGDTSFAAAVQVSVIGRAIVKVKPLSLGRARVTIVVFHPPDLKWRGARVLWSFATGRRFFDTATTQTIGLSRRVAVMWTTVPLPAGRFRFRACFHARGDHALVDPGRPAGCGGRGYHGSGRLPDGYPNPGNVGRTSGFLSGRGGRTAFATVDSEGRMSGLHEHWTFVSASVVKAMLLTAYLRRLHSIGQHTVDGFSNSFLYPMINVSDNSAATQTWSIVGDGGLYSVADAAGMTDFSIVGIWANAQISAADQAKFFFELDSLIPREFVGYARYLLSTIAGYESWGIPAVARPRGYNVFFKGGWRGTGLGQLVHQAARLEGPASTFSIAVMTDGDPSMGYGIETIQGVTGALLCCR
jgi:hypothetical protein